ncbi:MAG: hypothetical protein ACYCYK_13870 [Candidatus Dormibacteria bacterium]
MPLGSTSPVIRVMRMLLVPLIALAAARLLPTELGLLSTHSAVQSTIGDVVYFAHAAYGLVQGHTPYQPDFLTRPYQSLPYLYPPLTLLITLPPVVAESNYVVAFSVEILVTSLVGCAILGHFAKRLGASASIGVTTAVLLVAVGPVWLTRVDSIQGLLVAGSALALIGGRRSLAVALVTLACLIKETAVLAAVPVGLWCVLPAAESPVPWTLRIRESFLGLVPALVIFSAFLVWSRGGEVISSLASIHRGMEIESIPASVAIGLSPFVAVHPHFGRLAAWELGASDASALVAVATLLGSLLIAVGSTLLALAHRRPATAISFAIAVGLCATPVLSPQYLLDLLPVLVVAACVEFPKAAGARLILLGLLIAILTQADFPYLFEWVVTLQPAGIAVLLLRNGLLVVIAAIMARQVPWSRLRAAGREP